MEINVAEIRELLRRQITDFEKKVDVSEIGTVISVGDGIARVYGLEKCMASELLELPNGIFGMALNLEEDIVGTVLSGEDSLIKEGDIVKRTGTIMSVPVGDALAALDAIVAQDLISHSALPGLPPGLAGGKMAHQAFLGAFPDTQTTTEDLVAEGDRVVERYTARGTHTGDFLGAPPTGKKFAVESIVIFRFANGKIVEIWGLNDAQGLMMHVIWQRLRMRALRVHLSPPGEAHLGHARALEDSNRTVCGPSLKLT